MTNEEILTGLKDILTTIKPSLDLSGVDAGTGLITDLGLDSLTLLLLSLAIETRFGFTFDGTPRFEKVGDVINFISEKIN